MLSSILIDQREPAWVHKLTFEGIPIASGLLDAGDLLAVADDGNLLAIERMDAAELLHGIQDHSLITHFARLHAMSQFAYLLLTDTITPRIGGGSSINSHDSNWKYASIAGALLSIQEIGVYVLPIAGEQDYEAAVLRLGKRERGVYRVNPVRLVSYFSEAESVLCCLPQVGEERAKLLLAYCGSLADVLSYLSDDDVTDSSVRGVTTDLKRQVRGILGLHPDEILSRVTRDGTAAILPAVDAKRLTAEATREEILTW